jgi:alpha-L-fucosidase
MQPDEKIKWMLDDKLGMFIHWGLYAGPAKGEWYMENNGIPIEEYRKLAYAQSGENYFDASHYNPSQWMEIAKKVGFRYVNFTTEHHDGYALFESHYPNAFTSKQTHNRDFVREYVEAARNAGLKVGFYKTLINWRYPGYYDVTGTDCQKNNFGYTTAAWHKENARQMKEELYCQVKELMSNYGKIDQLFWDGGWLAQKGSDADAAYFWESGKTLSPNNSWPVDETYQLKDSITGKPLGLMGMVRQLQPDLVVNPRSGWIGDYKCEEGPSMVSGKIRSGVVEKCMTLIPTWGYSPAAEDPASIRSLKDIVRICSDCMVRNMCFLINVGPNRHGDIPQPVVDRLMEFGRWVSANSLAIYGTRGGPWQPVDGQYGFTYKDNMLFIYFLGGYTEDSFTLPPLPKGMKVKKAYLLDSKRDIAVKSHHNGETLLDIHPEKDAVTILAVKMNQPVSRLFH